MNDLRTNRINSAVHFHTVELIGKRVVEMIELSVVVVNLYLENNNDAVHCDIQRTHVSCIRLKQE